LNLFAWPGSEKPKPVPNRSVFGAASGGVEQLPRGTAKLIELIEAEIAHAEAGRP
jgi:hypothetical protein